MNINELKNKLKNEKEEKLILKQIEKERIKIHKDMLEKERINSTLEKIAPENSFISLQHINKIYDNHIQAVYDFNLEIKEHEFIVLLVLQDVVNLQR